MDAVQTLRHAVEKAGGQLAFSQVSGVSAQYVNDVLNGRKEPGRKILDAIGLERVVTHRKKPKQ